MGTWINYSSKTKQLWKIRLEICIPVKLIYLGPNPKYLKLLPYLEKRAYTEAIQLKLGD